MWAIGWALTAGAAEVACAPVDLAQGVPALLATTPPEPGGVGAEAWQEGSVLSWRTHTVAVATIKSVRWVEN